MNVIGRFRASLYVPSQAYTGFIDHVEVLEFELAVVWMRKEACLAALGLTR